ncbi:MAG: 3'(2'),5'-bisphosphate nucleotidase CysQ [Acetobacteraceae bacterium]|nr:3'(2'),5'-bisphosphate nucleotidase CysQ [Acetobacteraceae bacterium]
MNNTALLNLAADLAQQAGAVILAVRARGFETLRKTDRSPVTEADHAAEAIILAGLRAATPHIPVVAEEEIEAGHRPHATGEYWLVDPLDGTREFAAGRDEFTVNIGLVRDGAAVLGAVGVPAYGELFGGFTGPDACAWKSTGAARTPIRARATPAAGLHVLASRHYAGDHRLDEFLQGRHVAEISNIGSALKIVRLAEGAGDLYPRFGRTMEWDTAAPQAILEAAGGTLCTMAGDTLRYGKPDWANPPFVCTGLP